MLTPTHGWERWCVAELGNVELIRVRLVSTAALSECEGTISNAICSVHDSFPGEASSIVPGLSMDGSSD